MRFHKKILLEGNQRVSVTLNAVIKWLMQVTPAISGEHGLAARLLKSEWCAD